GKAARKDGFFIAPAELRSLRPDGREVLHARADIVLATSLPAAPGVNPTPTLPAYALTPQEAYRQGLLFHGPALQGGEAGEGCGEAGIVGFVRAAPPATAWLRQPLRPSWVTGPLGLARSLPLVVLAAPAPRGA